MSKLLYLLLFFDKLTSWPLASVRMEWIASSRADRMAMRESLSCFEYSLHPTQARSGRLCLVQ